MRKQYIYIYLYQEFKCRPNISSKKYNLAETAIVYLNKKKVMTMNHVKQYNAIGQYFNIIIIIIFLCSTYLDRPHECHFKFI